MYNPDQKPNYKPDQKSKKPRPAPYPKSKPEPEEQKEKMNRISTAVPAPVVPSVKKKKNSSKVFSFDFPAVAAAPAAATSSAATSIIVEAQDTAEPTIAMPAVPTMARKLVIPELTADTPPVSAPEMPIIFSEELRQKKADHRKNTWELEDQLAYTSIEQPFEAGMQKANQKAT